MIGNSLVSVLNVTSIKLHESWSVEFKRKIGDKIKDLN